MEAIKMELDTKSARTGMVDSLHGVASSLAADGKNVRFMELSMVDCSDIRSQWQAYFAGRFPIRMDRLPYQHETDREFFDRNWRGSKDCHDLPMTYENFMLRHYWQHAPRVVVRKKSGKPFKSGNRTAQVKRLVEHNVPSGFRSDGIRDVVTRMAYEFHGEEENYVVNASQCETAT